MLPETTRQRLLRELLSQDNKVNWKAWGEQKNANHELDRDIIDLMNTTLKFNSQDIQIAMEQLRKNPELN